MKNLLSKLPKFIAIATILFFTMLQSEAIAQNYYVYDGDTFSVMLTSNNADTRITKVEFSDNNQWHNFEIIEFENLEDTYEGGFAYTVKDGKGNLFVVDYYRDLDYIVVTSEDGGTEWELYRRPE